MRRIDTSVSAGSFHWCCDNLRICAGKDYCSESDIDHAELFRGNPEPIDYTNPIEFEKIINNNIIIFFEKCKERKYYNRNFDQELLKPNFKNGYITYRCSILGFHELLFPVKVCGRILGAIFCGQLLKNGEKEKELEYNIRKAFFDNNSDIFKDYDFEKAEKSEIELRNDLLDGVDKYKLHNQYPLCRLDNTDELIKDGWINKRRSRVLELDDYQELVNNFNIEVIKIENELINKNLKKTRKEYIENVVRDAIKNFYEKTSEIISNIGINVNTIAKYWQIVETVLEILFDKLPLTGIRIYGAQILNIGNSAYVNDVHDVNLPCVVLINEKKENFISFEDIADIKNHFKFQVKATDKESGKFILSLKEIPNYALASAIDYLEERELILKGSTYIKNNLNMENMDVFYYPVHDNLPHSSAIVYTYMQEKSNIYFLDEMDYIEKTMRNEMFMFSLIIFYMNRYLTNSVLQLNTEMQLSFFRHEIAHVLLGFNALNSKYINNLQILQLDRHKQESVKTDFIHTERMLRSTLENTR